MLSIKDYKVEISKGDSYPIDVTVWGADDDDCELIVSLKKNIEDDEAIWQRIYPVENGLATIELTYAETHYTPGRYYWDMRVRYSDGSLKTLIKPTSFTIVEVVGDV